jgi:hypothetical protein
MQPYLSPFTGTIFLLCTFRLPIASRQRWRLRGLTCAFLFFGYSVVAEVDVVRKHRSAVRRCTLECATISYAQFCRGCVWVLQDACRHSTLQTKTLSNNYSVLSCGLRSDRRLSYHRPRRCQRSEIDFKTCMTLAVGPHSANLVDSLGAMRRLGCSACA